MNSEPPLNEEDVPQGEWLCPRCRAIREIKKFNRSNHHRTKLKLNNHEYLNNNNIINNKNANKNLDNSNNNESKIDDNYYESKKGTIVHKTNGKKRVMEDTCIVDTVNDDNNNHNGKINSIIDNSNNQSFDYIETSRKLQLLVKLWEKKNPFTALVKISLSLNPREYELPQDYMPNIRFPGSSKKSISNSNISNNPYQLTSTTHLGTLSSSTASSREGRLSSYSVKRAQELDRDNLPSILRTCFICRKGWRKAPLINCDYCPLVYHIDCIDPPLTNIPVTRWMCPSHVEPIIEEKLLSSSSFSERIRLWDRFSKPIDHESIKLGFLKKIHKA